MLLCYNVREILLERSRSINENIDLYLVILFLLANELYILSGVLTLNGVISLILQFLESTESVACNVIRSRLTAAETVLGMLLGG